MKIKYITLSLLLTLSSNLNIFAKNIESFNCPDFRASSCLSQLSAAVTDNDYSKLKKLVDCGCNIRIQNSAILNLAILKRDKKMAEFLVSLGAKPDEILKIGQTIGKQQGYKGFENLLKDEI